MKNTNTHSSTIRGESSACAEDDSLDLRVPSPERPFFIDLELGFRIYVDKRTYNQYVRPLESEARTAERRTRCVIAGKRCNGDCSKCEFPRTGGTVSIDEQYEKYELELEDKSESIVDRLAREELINALVKAVESLPKEQKKIARFIASGMSSRQIAHALGIPQRTAYDRIQVVLKKLRSMLEPYK